MSRLRALRHDKGWTQTFLAARSGVSLRTLSSAEAGKPVRFSTKLKLCRALGIDWADRARVFEDAP